MRVSWGWPPAPACSAPPHPVRAGRCRSTPSTARSQSVVANSLVAAGLRTSRRLSGSQDQTLRRHASSGRACSIPNELSRVYTVRITLPEGRFPKVEVLDPVLETRPGESIPHLFGDGSLCLHLEDEWAPTMLMVDTTVPWTSEWLLNYEVWKGTGAWYGGGEWPPRRQELPPGRSTPARRSPSAAEI